jgi:hypothetical protein
LKKTGNLKFREQQFWKLKISTPEIVKIVPFKKYFFDVRIQPQGELKDKNFGIESYGEHTLLFKIQHHY